MVCSICCTDLLEAPDDGVSNEITALGCHHTFHTACINKALSHRNLKKECPECRAKVILGERIKLVLGKPLELEDLPMTQCMTQASRTELHHTVDAKAEVERDWQQKVDELREKTRLREDVNDVLDDEIKVSAELHKKIKKKMANTTTKWLEHVDRRNEFNALPRSDEVASYIAWRQQDINKSKREETTMDIASISLPNDDDGPPHDDASLPNDDDALPYFCVCRGLPSKSEQKRISANIHEQICESLKSVRRITLQREAKKQSTIFEDDKIRRTCAKMGRLYAQLEADARELGIGEHSESERKKRKEAKQREESIAMLSYHEISYDDETEVQVKKDFFGFRMDDSDAYVCDLEVQPDLPQSAPNSSKASSSLGAFDGGFVTKVYSEKADAHKKRKGLLQLFT
eukprot:GEMP01034341.1.p1 GENE.GEMP01034341.1~~GEMP01034341.1.p1  ORF type:complete len:403 (+),score=93.40 GEMP01034341.1:80-1288(+)